MQVRLVALIAALGLSGTAAAQQKTDIEARMQQDPARAAQTAEQPPPADPERPGAAPDTAAADPNQPAAEARAERHPHEQAELPASPHGVDPTTTDQRGEPRPRAEELRPDDHQEPVATTLTEDRQITQRVVLSLSEHPQLGQRPIAVATEDGTVTLTGHVASETEAKLAEQLAQRQDQVVSVESELLIDTDLAEAER